MTLDRHNDHNDDIQTEELASLDGQTPNRYSSLQVPFCVSPNRDESPLSFRSSNVSLRSINGWVGSRTTTPNYTGRPETAKEVRQRQSDHIIRPSTAKEKISDTNNA